MEQNNELYHYGVLGMKWGVHRARKKGTTYSYTSSRTKRYNKKADKYAKKAEKAKSKGDDVNAKRYKEESALNAKKAKRSADFDKSMETSVRNSSTGKTALKIALNGPFGAKTYEAAKAAGHSQAKAAGITVLSTYLGGPIGNMVATSVLRTDYVNKED